MKKILALIISVTMIFAVLTSASAGIWTKEHVILKNGKDVDLTDFTDKELKELADALYKHVESNDTKKDSSASSADKTSAGYSPLDFKALARNPENYTTTLFEFTGTVLQVVGTRAEGYTIRLATSGKYDDVVLLYIASEDTPSSNILEDDVLLVHGLGGGEYTYESTLGSKITVPLIYVSNVTIQ